MNPNVQAAKSALTAFQGSQKSANDILNSAMTQYGVQGAQDTKNNLETTLNNTTKALNAVPDSVTGRTSRSLVTEAQRQAIVNNEQNPIRQALSDQQGEYGIASNNYSDLSGKATALANAELGQQSAKESQLEQNYQDAVSQAAAQLAAQQEAAKEAEQKREFNISSAQSAQKSGGSQAPQYTWSKQAGGGYNVLDSSGKVVKTDLATAVASQGGNLSNLVSLLASGSKSDRSAANQYMKLIQQNKPTQAYNYLVQHTGAFYTGGGF